MIVWGLLQLSPQLRNSAEKADFALANLCRKFSLRKLNSEFLLRFAENRSDNTMKTVLYAFAALSTALCPAIAKSATVIEGDLRITSASFDDCPVGFNCADYVPKVGNKVQFQVTLGDNAPRDGVFNSTGIANAFASGKLAYASIIFKEWRPVGGGIFVESGDDVCGGGASLGFNATSVFGSETRCGYKYSIYPFINTSYEGKVTKVTVNGIAVPEPETYIYLILGFGIIGLILRRRNAARPITENTYRTMSPDLELQLR